MSAAKQRRVQEKRNLLRPVQTNSLTVPRALNVTEFVGARSSELNEFSKAIRSNTSMRRVYQRVPRHIRRRAMAHDPKRLSRSLVHSAQREMGKMDQTGSTTPKRSRKTRRSPRVIYLDHIMRAARFKWLETHLYNAKRMHMGNVWGHRLPIMTTDKSQRAISKIVTNQCVISEQSHLIQVHVTAPFYLLSLILALMNPHFDNYIDVSQGNSIYNTISPDARIQLIDSLYIRSFEASLLHNTTSSTESNVNLHYPSLRGLTSVLKTISTHLGVASSSFDQTAAYSYCPWLQTMSSNQLISPARVQWLPCSDVVSTPSSSSLRTIWLWLHPASSSLVLHVLKNINTLLSSHFNSINVPLLVIEQPRQQLCRFSLRGPTSIAVLSRALRVHSTLPDVNNNIPSITNSDASLWDIYSTQPPHTITPNQVLTLKVTNPKALVTHAIQYSSHNTHKKQFWTSSDISSKLSSRVVAAVDLTRSQAKITPNSDSASSTVQQNRSSSLSTFSSAGVLGPVASKPASFISSDWVPSTATSNKTSIMNSITALSSQYKKTDRSSQHALAPVPSPLYSHSALNLLSSVSPLSVLMRGKIQKHLTGKMPSYLPSTPSSSSQSLLSDHDANIVAIPTHGITRDHGFGFWHQAPSLQSSSDDIDPPLIVTERNFMRSIQRQYQYLPTHVAASQKPVQPHNVKGCLVTYIHLVSRGPDHPDSHVHKGQETPVHAVTGWDIIVPPGWGQSFYSALILAGAKNIGIIQQANINIEHGYKQDAYPFFHPHSIAGINEFNTNRYNALIKYLRTVKNRVDVWTRHIPYPLGPHWSEIEPSLIQKSDHNDAPVSSSSTQHITFYDILFQHGMTLQLSLSLLTRLRRWFMHRVQCIKQTRRQRVPILTPLPSTLSTMADTDQTSSSPPPPPLLTKRRRSSASDGDTKQYLPTTKQKKNRSNTSSQFPIPLALVDSIVEAMPRIQKLEALHGDYLHPDQRRLVTSHSSALGSTSPSRSLDALLAGAIPKEYVPATIRLLTDPLSPLHLPSLFSLAKRFSKNSVRSAKLIPFDSKPVEFEHNVDLNPAPFAPHVKSHVVRRYRNSPHTQREIASSCRTVDYNYIDSSHLPPFNIVYSLAELSPFFLLQPSSTQKSIPEHVLKTISDISPHMLSICQFDPIIFSHVLGTQLLQNRLNNAMQSGQFIFVHVTLSQFNTGVFSVLDTLITPRSLSDVASFSNPDTTPSHSPTEYSELAFSPRSTSLYQHVTNLFSSTPQSPSRCASGIVLQSHYSISRGASRSESSILSLSHLVDLLWLRIRYSLEQASVQQLHSIIPHLDHIRTLTQSVISWYSSYWRYLPHIYSPHINHLPIFFCPRLSPLTDIRRAWAHIDQY